MLPVLRHRGFALLWTGGIVSQLGDWLLLIALPVAVFELTGSALATAGVFAADLVPRLLLSSVAGVFVDRWDRRRTMIAAELLQATALLPLLLVQSAEMVWLVYPVSALRVAIAQFFGPAQQSLIPRLVPEADLVAANAASGLAINVSRLAGPAIGGSVFGLLGLGGVALLDVVSFLGSALLIAQIRQAAAPLVGSGRPVAAQASLLGQIGALPREWLAGLRVVRGNRELIGVFGVTAAHGLAEGTISALVIVWVHDALKGGAPELGWMLSAQAIGSVLAGLALARFGNRLRPVYLAGVGFLLVGLSDLAIWNLPWLPLTLTLFALAGVPFAGIGPGLVALIQSSTPDGFRGRVFGARTAVLSLATLVSLTAAGALVGVAGMFSLLSVGALCRVVGALWFLWLLRGSKRPG